jgi:hypothetical protein
MIFLQPSVTHAILVLLCLTTFHTSQCIKDHSSLNPNTYMYYKQLINANDNTMTKKMDHDIMKKVLKVSGGFSQSSDSDDENDDGIDNDDDDNDDNNDDNADTGIDEGEESNDDNDDKDDLTIDEDTDLSSEENNRDEGDDSSDDSEDNISDSKKRPKKILKKSKKSNKRKKPSVMEIGVGGLATAASAAFKLTKGGVKTAVDLISAKHVTLNQIVGKWRMEQDVQVSKDASITCPATLEFTEQGQVVTSFNGKVYTSEFKLTIRPWPRKCTISFEATAFQGPKDKEPVSMYYKGYFKRSIMNPNVILMRGKVYRLKGKFLWKSQKRCGVFKATQRRYR